MTTDGGPTLVEAVKSGSVSFRMSAASIAVALRKAVGGALAEGCPGQGAHLQPHQSLGGKANHVAQNICVGGISSRACYTTSGDTTSETSIFSKTICLLHAAPSSIRAILVANLISVCLLKKILN